MSDDESIDDDMFIDESEDESPYEFYFHEDEKEKPRKPKNIRIVHVVEPHKRRTSNMISEFEMTRAISIRAKRIDMTGHSYVTPKFDDAISIAKQEFIERRNPLILIRQVSIGNNSEIWVEKWKVREMAYPDLPNNPLKL